MKVKGLNRTLYEMKNTERPLIVRRIKLLFLSVQNHSLGDLLPLETQNLNNKMYNKNGGIKLRYQYYEHAKTAPAEITSK